jgi:hypothetical protein
VRFIDVGGIRQPSAVRSDFSRVIGHILCFVRTSEVS